MTTHSRKVHRFRLIPLVMLGLFSIVLSRPATAQHQQHHGDATPAMSDSTMQAMRGQMMDQMDPDMAAMHASMMSQMDSTMMTMHDQMMQMMMMGMHGGGMMTDDSMQADMDGRMQKMARMHETMMPMMQQMMQRVKDCGNGN